LGVSKQAVGISKRQQSTGGRNVTINWGRGCKSNSGKVAGQQRGSSDRNSKFKDKILK